MKRMGRGLILAVLLAVPCFFLYGVEADRGSLEEQLREGFPFAQELRQLGLDLRLLDGQREQNHIFISEKGLMKNIGGADDGCVEKNTAALNNFENLLSENSDGKKHTYLALIPTAAGVQRQNLPRFAESELLDQRRKIEEIYNQVAVGVRTVDVYSSLQNHRDEYIYYRTHHSLTALGGYWTYTAMARRLETTVRPFKQFDIEYVKHNFYGDLYRAQQGGGATAPYRKIPPDLISLFHLNSGQAHAVTLEEGGESRVYHTLYPRHRMELGGPMDVYLGGTAAVTRVQSSAAYGGRLLVVGDSGAQAYLPFLATHFYQTTLVNVEKAEGRDLAAIRPAQYDQTLFAFSLEHFIQGTLPAKAELVNWKEAP